MITLPSDFWQVVLYYFRSTLLASREAGTPQNLTHERELRLTARRGGVEKALHPTDRIGTHGPSRTHRNETPGTHDRRAMPSLTVF